MVRVERANQLDRSGHTGAHPIAQRLGVAAELFEVGVMGEIFRHNASFPARYHGRQFSSAHEVWPWHDVRNRTDSGRQFMDDRYLVVIR